MGAELTNGLHGVHDQHHCDWYQHLIDAYKLGVGWRANDQMAGHVFRILAEENTSRFHLFFLRHSPLFFFFLEGMRTSLETFVALAGVRESDRTTIFRRSRSPEEEVCVATVTILSFMGEISSISAHTVLDNTPQIHYQLGSNSGDLPLTWDIRPISPCCWWPLTSVALTRSPSEPSMTCLFAK